MARRPWLGLPLTSLLSPREEREGLVLSGGGSKASFQIGALRYLYERAGIAPTVVVGTSAGSIISAMIAQSSDPAEQAASIRELERLWFEMEEQSDMFTERAWFRRFRARSPELMALLQRDHAEQTASPRPAWRAGASLPRIQLPFTRGSALDLEDQPQHDPSGPGSPNTQDARPLSPQLETLALATNDPDVAPAEFSPAMVLSVLSGLSRMRGVGTDLGLILSGAEKTRSMYVPGPLLQELLGSGVFDATKIGEPGLTVRIAVTALESGELRFLREDGMLVDREDVPIGGTAQELTRGVLASCSIPAVFVPVALDDETYVDGGVRENLPAEMAIGHLGCTTTWVVTSNAPGAKSQPSYAERDMISVMMRATEIMSDETERDEVAYARSAGAKVIEPEIGVHDALTIDPGLIRINRDYGWMRAAEAHLQLDAVEQGLTRGVIQLRCQAWELECSVLDPDEDTDGADLARLTRMKFELRDQVKQLRPEIRPEDAERWWIDWEAHTPPATMPPPWLH